MTAAEVPPEVRAQWREKAERFTAHEFARWVLAMLDALDAAERERDQLRRGGKNLGKDLVFWLDLAVRATGSEDCVEDDGDGDYGAVAVRLAALGSRAEAAERRLAAVRALADERLAVHGPHVECNNAGCRRRGLSGMHCADPCEEPHEDCADFAAWTKVRAALGDADGGEGR